MTSNNTNGTSGTAEPETIETLTAVINQMKTRQGIIDIALLSLLSILISGQLTPAVTRPIHDSLPGKHSITAVVIQ